MDTIILQNFHTKVEILIANSTEKHLNNFRYVTKYNLLKENIQNHSSDMEMNYQLALTVLELGKIEEAREIYDNMMRLNSGSFYLSLLESAFHRKDENYSESLKITNQVIEDNPFSPDAYYERASIFSEVGQIEKAEENIDKSLSFDSDNLEYMYSMALIKRYQGEEQESIKLLQKVLDQDPNHSIARNRLAFIHYDLGDREKAQELFTENLKLNPQDEMARVGYRKSIKAQYGLYYRWKQKLKALQGKYQSSQLIFGAMIAVFAVIIILQLIEYFSGAFLALRSLSILLAIITTIVIYQDMVMNVWLLRNSKFASTLNKSERGYIVFSTILIVAGLLSVILGALIMSNATIIVVGGILLLLPFFLRFVFYHKVSRIWSILKLGIFILLSILAINLSTEQAIVFNAGFVWLLILGLIEVWIQFMYKKY